MQEFTVIHNVNFCLCREVKKSCLFLSRLFTSVSRLTQGIFGVNFCWGDEVLTYCFDRL